MNWTYWSRGQLGELEWTDQLPFPRNANRKFEAGIQRPNLSDSMYRFRDANLIKILVVVPMATFRFALLSLSLPGQCKKHENTREQNYRFIAQN
ncbi:hypothetical protein PGT21_014723 [Puccinia graminis f. sp. tritici]|uniref:Uncharacterized protein n=1 Tax=Puccinia graminis f. sp. tritici TaxID=56615 RepID=A0A5B0NGB2_PUCGR|nr:hypothetical protein PGT21_014723 [Puccinia graminis f. sp. tritici]